jgi:N-acetylglucosaminyldiphosphoundecaprenol N-acetyl-beta-D-mannosaminyltransferase
MGVDTHALTMDQVISIVDDRIASRDALLIGVVNAAKIVNMRRDEELRRSVETADLVLADGMAVVWASRILRQSLPARVAGIDLMTRMLELSNERKYRVFCLGASEEVLSQVVVRIENDYPNLKLVGHQHGYYRPDEEEQVADRIAAAKPDILFVAMTSPKKERFLAKWSAKMDVTICHGVGGSFDVMAGKVKRAPAFWQKIGMEWLYRVLQEPRRMWRRYLVTNTLFAMMLFSELVRPRRRRNKPSTDAVTEPSSRAIL